MSVPARIADKLGKFERGPYAYESAVDDIYTLIHCIADLEEEIEDLRIKAGESDAWRGRYYALLEECEASRAFSRAMAE